MGLSLNGKLKNDSNLKMVIRMNAFFWIKIKQKNNKTQSNDPYVSTSIESIYAEK